MLARLIHRVVSSPRVYDTVQRLAGRERVHHWLATHLAGCSGKTVLDVGGGTGALTRILPASATYIWLDNDVKKLDGLQGKVKGARAVLGDATRIGLREKSVDFALCIAVSHHLTDDQFDAALRELARICRLKLIFLDAIRDQTSALSKFLWKYDRGSFPRTVDELRRHIEKRFVIQTEAYNSVYHHYWLCAARPKDT
jgi:ubiquinone/menaquinone biosynthesis C-methylase UbiE